MPRTRPTKSTSAPVKTKSPSKSSLTPMPAPATTKQEQILALLSRPQGANITDLMTASRWQAHSVRGFLAGTVKKRLGLALVSSKAEGEARCYRIETRRSR